MSAISAADFTLYNDKILGAVNRSVDHRLRGPGDRRPDLPAHLLADGDGAATTGTITNTIAGDPANHLTFTQVGTSMSAAIVTGAYRHGRLGP